VKDVHPCEVRTERDVDWAVKRVLLGERVVVHVGGMRRPRRHQLKYDVALCCLAARIEGFGGQVVLGQDPNAIGRLTRGQTALLLPPEPDNGELGGVREPRRPTPNPSTTRANAKLPEYS
jgi:hypothetical protein